MTRVKLAATAVLIAWAVQPSDSHAQETLLEPCRANARACSSELDTLGIKRD